MIRFVEAFPVVRLCGQPATPAVDLRAEATVEPQDKAKPVRATKPRRGRKAA